MSRLTQIIRMTTVHLLIAFMLMSTAFGVFPFESIDAFNNVYAASANLEQGDLLTIRESGWDQEFIVLDPDETNTGKPGIFLLRKDYSDKTAFNYEDADLESANNWENSLAQEWCAGYYQSMPDTVRNAVIGVKTVETESGFKWAGVNNIDGTRTGLNSNKDKVFFLSYIEYDTYRTSAGITLGEKWLLRSPYACGDLKVYVCVVTEDGSIHDFGTSWPAILGARPAFNIEPSLETASSTCRHGNNVTWVIGTGSSDTGYENVTYTWSSDNRRCTAKAFCRNCGKNISETADASVNTRDATTEAAGSTTYSVKFKDAGFTSQTKTVSIPKKSSVGTILNKKLPKPVLKVSKRSGNTVTVKWKAVSRAGRKKISGIEIMAATDKQFKKNRVIKTAKKTKSSYRIKGLKKKTYWIRIRTYKISGGHKYVSKWSKARKVKKR